MFQYASSRGDSLAKAMAEQLEANVGKSPAGTNTVSETTSSRFRNYDYTIQKLQVQAQHDPTCNSLLQSHSLPLRSVCVTIELFLKPLPSQSPTCNSFLNFTASPFQGFLSRVKIMFITAPPKPLVSSTSQPHLSKGFGHDSKSFLTPPPKALYAIVFLRVTASPFEGFLSRVKVIFIK